MDQFIGKNYRASLQKPQWQNNKSIAVRVEIVNYIHELLGSLCSIFLLILLLRFLSAQLLFKCVLPLVLLGEPPPPLLNVFPFAGQIGHGPNPFLIIILCKYLFSTRMVIQLLTL